MFFCAITGRPCLNDDKYHRCKGRICAAAMFDIMWVELELYAIEPQDGELASIYGHVPMGVGSSTFLS